MKDYHRNHLCQPTGMETKRNRIKNYGKDEICCKCSSPFANIHCHECPLANKPCPVHRAYMFCDTNDKIPTDQERMVISFHPSKKTDRFLQPIKSILASNCNSETKINFQYFSPKNLNTVMLKNRQIQTNIEDNPKVYSGGSCFVEKTKSYVAGKTNKMKRLKQCFYSPCNSVVEKTRSQSSVKEEKPSRRFASPKGFVWGSKSQENRNPNVFLYCCDTLASSDAERSLVSDSDYLTVTENLKPNNVNKKIFEISQSRNITPSCKTKGNQTQFVYFSTVEDQNETEQTNEYEKPVQSKILSDTESIKKEETKDSEESSSDKFQSDSSRSVYFTPFILVPKGVEKSDVESDRKSESENSKADKEIQSEGKFEEEKNPVFLSTCSSPFILVKQNSFNEEPDNAKARQKPSLSLEEGHRKGSTNSPSQTSVEISKADIKSLVLEVVREIKSDSSEARNKSTQYPSPSLSSTFHIIKKEEAGASSVEYFKYLGDGYNDKTVQTDGSQGSSSSTQTSRSVGVCTCDTLDFKERKFEVRSETCQTDCKVLKDVEVEAVEAKTNQSQMAAPVVTVISVQTQEVKTDGWTQTTNNFQILEFIDLDHSDSSNLTYVKKSFLSQDSDPGLEKQSELWCQKFHSDGEIYNKVKCECKTENEIPLSRICQCVRKEPTTDKAENSKAIKVIFDAGMGPKAETEGGKSQAVEPKKVDTKEDGINTSFSDLSELRKIINDHFDKMFDEALRVPTPCFDRGVQTDRIEAPIKKEKTEVEAQTSACLIQPKPVVTTTTDLVCMKCTKEVNTFVDVGTCTDDSLRITKRIDAETHCQLTEIKTVKIEDAKQNKLETFEKKIDSTTRKSVKPPQKPTPVKKDKTEKPVPAPRKSVTKPGPEGFQACPRPTRRLDTIQPKPPSTQTKPKTVNFSLNSQQSKVATLTKSTVQSDCVCETNTKPSTSGYSGRSNAATPVPNKPKGKTDNTVPPKAKPKTQTSHITYPVVVKTVWPRNLVECIQESIPKESFLESTSTKRNLILDTDTETPIGKKIRNNEIQNPDIKSSLQKCFVFGKPQGNKTNMRKDTGFVWVPSVSTPQFRRPEQPSCSCGKATSEEQVRPNTTTKTIPSLTNCSNLFTVKSFHHTNMKLLGEEPIRKLFECAFCKSLTYLKPRCDQRNVEIAFLQRENDYDEEVPKDSSQFSDRSEFSRASIQTECLEYEHEYLCEEHDKQNCTESVEDEFDNESEENTASD